MNWWHYLLLVNIYLILFYGFYTLLLRKETYFQLNRVYLVAASLLSFFIPLIQSDWVKNLFITEQVRYRIYGGALNFYAYKPVESNPLTIGQALSWLYVAGIAVLTIRFILQLVRINKMINAPTPSTAAYSFFKKISMGENMVKDDAIMAHEQVHARQWHSVDVLLIEAVMIINWFNPIVYLYRFAIKHIHEFIADRQAIQVWVDKKEYALLLLSQTFGTPSHQLVNPFYTHSLLKQRIMMIQKNRSQRIVLFKYILSAPLFGLMLILSSATINNSKAITAIHTKANKIFKEPATSVINSVTIDPPKTTETLKDEVPVDIPDSTASAGNSTQPVETDAENKVYDNVEKEPEFPGGMQQFYKFLQQTVKYPADARESNVQGRVGVTFIVERDGSLTNINVARSPLPSIGEEAIRAVRLSPKWNPGTQNGRPVRVMYTVPVNFTLSSDVTPTPTANMLYDRVEKEPEFPGGMQKFYAFLTENIKYPADARRDNIQGRVAVSFVVETDGSLSDVKAPRAISPSLGEEAVRVVSQSPKWKPGIQNGRPVRVFYTVPVNFDLNIK